MFEELVIYSGIRGSQFYRTATSKSDVDTFDICAESIDSLLSGAQRNPKHIKKSSEQDCLSETAGTFIRGLYEGKPNYVEMAAEMMSNDGGAYVLSQCGVDGWSGINDIINRNTYKSYIGWARAELSDCSAKNLCRARRILNTASRLLAGDIENAWSRNDDAKMYVTQCGNTTRRRRCAR